MAHLPSIVNRAGESYFATLTPQQKRTICWTVAGGLVGATATITCIVQKIPPPECFINYQQLFKCNLYVSIQTMSGAAAGAVIGALLPNSPIIATAMACGVAAFLILK